MRDNRNLLDRRLFWPRPGRPEALGEIDFDQPCGNCGYNLRGIEPGSRCPECGSRFGWNTNPDPIPWDERQTIGTFFATVAYTIIHPHELARQLWSPGGIDPKAARRFRRIAISRATLPLAGIAWAITTHNLGQTIAWCSLPLQLAAIVVWLDLITRQPMMFFREHVRDSMMRRVESVLAYATTAALPLTWLHLFLLIVTVRHPSVGPPMHWMEATAAHVGLLLLTLLPGVIGIACMIYETVDVRPIVACVTSLSTLAYAAVSAALLLVAVPMMSAVLLKHLFG